MTVTRQQEDRKNSRDLDQPTKRGDAGIPIHIRPEEFIEDYNEICTALSDSLKVEGNQTDQTERLTQIFEDHLQREVNVFANDPNQEERYVTVKYLD